MGITLVGIRALHRIYKNGEKIPFVLYEYFEFSIDSQKHPLFSKILITICLTATIGFNIIGPLIILGYLR